MISAQSRSTISLYILTLALLPCGANAFEYSGYFRRNLYQDSSDNGRAPACYGLSGPGMKYRLGNECDVYGELVLKQAVKAGDVEIKGQATPAYWKPQINAEPTSIKFAEAFVSASGFSLTPEASLWIGKRFYGRADVHIADTKFTQMDGRGLGIEGIKTGVGKLSVAFFSNALNASGNPAADRTNIELSDIGINPGGRLRAAGTWTRGKQVGGTSGSGFTLQHNQSNFLGLGGENVAWIQWANGSANLNGDFGGLTNTSDVKATRIVESFTWQKGKLGGQALMLRQVDVAAGGATTYSTSLGGRLSYGVMENFKLLAELGRSLKSPDGAARQQLTKLTIAPTWSLGQDFWSRPEVRFYFTRAVWNDAAEAAAGVNGVTGNPRADRTSGSSAGIQVEHWF